MGDCYSAHAKYGAIDGKGQTTTSNDPKSLIEFPSDAKPVAIVIHSAKDIYFGDVLGEPEVYAMLHVRPEGSTGTNYGRQYRSNLVSGPNPVWMNGLLLDVAGIDKPEVCIKLYDRDCLTADDFLGHASVSLSKLEGGVPLEISLDGGKGAVTLSAGTQDHLDRIGVKPDAKFPYLHDLGEAKSCMASDVKDDYPLRTGKAPLPESLRGVFWLSGQGEGSALATFAGPSSDGGGCSAGHLIGTEKPKYKIRCGGDRSWAEASRQPQKNHHFFDLIYHFVFDSADNPAKAQIYPEWQFIPAPFTFERVLDFEMELQEKDGEYPGSKVWLRKTYHGGSEMLDITYKLIQIIDETGARIEPAFSKFVAYQESVNADDPSKKPGLIYYREIADTKSATK
eukprot:TRINITY_DN100246_c0_g1_i1.p1 TRINITY_DN100246_c0_g1~~TRINITY_DN100246_c0_g1_i1.p1  ORF type:complete len:395 (-),score=55.35 TRINITY_DN100246_c0_g1_i1:395-1579(-)